MEKSFVQKLLKWIFRKNAVRQENVIIKEDEIMSLVKFEGLIPSTVAKDTKYSVHSAGEGYKIALLYRTSDGETWHMSNEEHSLLANMVNKVKTEVTGSPGGSFYINEFKQVLVKANDVCYLAGEYDTPLKFEFDGKIISGEARNLDGKPLEPGDIWVGPHVGIIYILAAGGGDIKCKFKKSQDITVEKKLSQAVGLGEANKVARSIAKIKGNAGGRIYVNEFGNIFTPKNSDDGIDYIYVGAIDYKSWFSKPHA